MGSEFKGHHSLTLYEGRLCVSLWKGKCHTVTIGVEEEIASETPEQCDQLVAQIIEMLA